MKHKTSDIRREAASIMRIINETDALYFAGAHKELCQRYRELMGEFPNVEQINHIEYGR